MKCENPDLGQHELGDCPNICDDCYDHLDKIGRLNTNEGPGLYLNVTKIAALVRDQGEECIVEHRGGNIFTLCAGPVVAHDLDTHEPRYAVVGCGGSGDRDEVASGKHDVTCFLEGFEVIPDYSVDERHPVVGHGPKFEWVSGISDTEETVAAMIVAKIRERMGK